MAKARSDVKDSFSLFPLEEDFSESFHFRGQDVVLAALPKPVVPHC